MGSEKNCFRSVTTSPFFRATDRRQKLGRSVAPILFYEVTAIDSIAFRVKSVDPLPESRARFAIRPPQEKMRVAGDFRWLPQLRAAMRAHWECTAGNVCGL